MVNVRLILWNLLVIATILVSLELILRVVGYPYSRHMVSHPIYHHAMRPNTVGRVASLEYSHEHTVNAVGMRDNETDGHTLLLGDSFIEGVGVGDRDTVDSAMGWGYLNAGVSSHSPIIHYLRYKEERAKFRAMGVCHVVLFLDWGDFQDDQNYEKKAIWKDGKVVACPGPLVQEKRTLAIVDYLNRERPHIKVKRYVFGRMAKWVLGPNRYVAWKRSLGMVDKHTVDKFDPASDRYMILREGGLEAAGEQLARTKGYILALRDEVEADGLTFTLVLYPLGVSVSGDEWDEGREFWGFEKGQIYGLDAHIKVTKWSIGQGILTWSVTPDFYYYHLDNPHVRLFYREDGHMTKEGYCLMGRSVKRALSERYTT